jgi:hypothetical protein
VRIIWPNNDISESSLAEEEKGGQRATNIGKSDGPKLFPGTKRVGGDKEEISAGVFKIRMLEEENWK